MKTHNSHLLIILSLMMLGATLLAGCGKDREPAAPNATESATEAATEAVTEAASETPAAAFGAAVGSSESVSATPLAAALLPATDAPVSSATPPAPATTASATTVQDSPFGAVTGSSGETPATLVPPTAGATAAPTTASAPGVNFGPVVGPDYTLPPTETRLPPTSAPADAVAASPVSGVPITPQPGGAFGPLVGPDYVLPPTETRPPPPPVAPTSAPTAGPSPTPYPGLNPTLIGVQIHPNISAEDFQRVLAHAHALNVTWIKMQFNWSLLEFAPGVFTDLFYGMRRYIQQAHDEGFKVMISVAKAPGWSRSPGADGELREAGPPDDPAILAEFMSRLLVMIGADSTGRPFIDAIEVWNEPNLQREWYGHPLTGQEYMRYFGPAYNAIRAWSPAITIITAAPAPTGNSDHSTDDRAWLQQLYNAGLASYGADVQIGIHPYGWANAPDAVCCASPSRGWDDRPQFFFLNTIEDYRRIVTANGHSAAHLWTTEFGWPTFDGLIPANGGPTPAPPSDESYFGFIDQWQQADYTMRAFALAQERDYMGPMILWNLNFSTVPNAVEEGDKKTGYSLLTGQGQPRPIYQSLQQALTY